MKLIVLTWRDPAGSLTNEQFDAAEVKIRTDPGWLRLIKGDQLMRIIPSDKVCLVQFIEQQEEPRILKPEIVPDLKKYQAS